jgi:hypothetical protein
MTDFVQVTLVVTLFRTAMIFVGLGFAYLGYKLFRAGVYEHAGDLRAAWGERNLVLKQAAPGTFFALFGVVVIGISIFRGTGLQVETIPVSSTGSDAAFTASDDYPTVPELLEKNEIQADELPRMALAVFYNVYLHGRQLGVTDTEIETIFRDVLSPALKRDLADEDEELPKNLADARLELFKYMTPTPRSSGTKQSSVKFGLGL